MPVIDKIFAKIPLLNTPDVPIMRASQDMVPLADVVDNILLYKDGGGAIILETSSLNFGLLSEREQEAVIAAFAAMINSLSFAVQISVRTQRKNIGSYLSYLDGKILEMKNPKLKDLMLHYKAFISETIRKRNVLGKRFFLIIPFSPLELGFSKSMIPGASHKGPIPYTEDYILKKIKTVLYPKRDHLIRQCARLGLKATQLDKDSVIRLFYDIYNPDVEAVKEQEEIKVV
jgi:hypothetical protein